MEPLLSTETVTLADPPASPREALILPDTPRALRAEREVVETSPTISPDAPLVHGVGATVTTNPILDSLRDEAVAQVRREGSWAVGRRALVVVVGLLLTVRLIFDPMLPALLFAAGGVSLVVVTAALLAKHRAERARREVVLAALSQVVQLAREQPALLPSLSPRIEAAMAALCEPASLWPSSRAESSWDQLARTLAQHASGTDGAPRRSLPG